MKDGCGLGCTMLILTFFGVLCAKFAVWLWGVLP